MPRTLALLAVLSLSVPRPEHRVITYTDVSGFDAAKLRHCLGKPVILTRALDSIGYDDDWTEIVLEKTDDWPEVSCRFLWWTLPYEFEEDVQTNPQRQYVVTLRGILAAHENRWVIRSPQLVRWD